MCGEWERTMNGSEQARKTAESLTYSSGFGNEHSSEAVPGALPHGRNSPQRAPLGLYAEQLSGSAFTEPRARNRRSWLYRIRPSAAHPPYRRTDNGALRSAPFTESVPDPNRLRWNPLPEPAPGTDFLAGLWTVGGNGDTTQRTGMAVHLYHANLSMTDRVFSDADGELLIVPEHGGLLLRTEFGLLHAGPGQIALIPRGVRFRVELLDESARGYVCENYGSPFQLPDLGPIGANGLANARDFLAPTAAYEDVEGPVQVVNKYCGNLWTATYDHSPSTSSPGTAITSRTSTTCTASTSSAASATTTPTRRSSRSSPPPPTPRAWRASTSWSSRRAGWSARTRSGRRTSTAM